MNPLRPPIGRLLSQTAKSASRAFEAALAEAGGSSPTWWILITLMNGRPETQAHLAEAVGIRGPTLTHHLNSMEKDGLLTRTRLADNRRVHQVALTEKGEALFHQMRRAAMGFDAHLRGGFSPEELETLRGLLERLAARVAGA